ncbi:MAG: hypothetical protein NUV35_09185, partial [Syntrophomonadaceae bacterium]|nr:hypothetical protein [Syntrophomonadaceae bacterium]
ACLPRRQVLPLCAHGINVVDALELGRVLGQAPAQVRIVGVEIASEEAFREGLTPAVAAAVAPACDAVREEVLRMLGGEGPSGSARE